MKSLRTKMVLAFSVPVAILLIVFAFVFTNQIKNTIMPLTEEMSAEIVSNRAVQVNYRIDDYLREALVISKEFFSGYAVDMSTVEASRLSHHQSLIRKDIAMRYRALRTGFYNVFYVDKLGTRYEGDGITTSEVKDSDYFKEILINNKDALVSTPYFNDQGELVFDVFHELRNDDDVKVGLLGLQVPFTPVGQLAVDSSIGSQGFGWVIDDKGLVIAHPEQSVAMKLNLLQGSGKGYKGLEAMGERALKSLPGTATITLANGDKNLVFYQPMSGAAPWTLAISVPLEAIMSRANALRMFTILAFALLFVLSFIVAVVMANNVANPVKRMASELNSISEGNLGGCVELARSDEVGQMAICYNKMLATIKEMVTGITAVIEAISKDSQTLTVVTENNSSALAEVASTTVQFASTAEHSSGQARKMSVQAQGSLALTTQGMKHIEVTEKIMGTIDHTAKQSAAAIRALDRETRKIGQMIDSISEIAEQTNLLALNAAIEAARAGEEGRGFSVVAQEVRKLAEQTQSLVTGVRSTMGQVSVQAEQAVKASAANDREVNHGIEALAETRQAFNSIAQNIEETVRSFQEVAQAAQELSLGSDDISRATEQQIGSVAEVANVAVSVGRMVEELKVLVAKFEL